MSILSSSLTGEFIRAAASGARARSAEPAAGSASFRDQLDAARDERRPDLTTDESSHADQSTRDTDEADATTEDRDRDRDRDEASDREDSGERRRDATDAEAADTDATPDIQFTSIDPVVPAASATELAGAGAEQTVATEVAVATGVAPENADIRDSAEQGIASRDLHAGAGLRPTGPDAPRADAAVHAGTAVTANVPATGNGLAEAAPTTNARPGSGDAAANVDSVTNGGQGAKDSAREGGSIRLEGVRTTAETTVDRSAYRSAMADRAAGRDLAPAERQALALDQRIAQARAEAAGRASGTRAGGTTDGGSAVAASGGLASGGAAGTRRATGIGPAAASTSSATPVNGSGAPSSATTAATITAPTNVSAPADLGVAARPGPAPAPGVPAVSADSGPAAAGRGAGEPPALAQALRGARMLVGRDGGSMTVRLNPGTLGDLRVRVDIQGGRVTAEFQTTTDAARDQIERGLDTLRRGLEERGLQVERLTVRPAPETDSGRGPRTDDAAGRERSAGSGGDGQSGEGRDDAAGRESDGRQHEPPARRPIGERASTPDALRAFASIFGEQTQ